MLHESLNRRQFLVRAALTGAALAASSSAVPARRLPGTKLNIACIGVGGQGANDLANVSSENIVAMCDVDDARSADSFKKFPGARKYRDYRRMLEEGHDIEAVVVSIPDHSHAAAAILAMNHGKHVYCQKPLAHSVGEARRMLEVARRRRVVTQMGTQGHPAYARTVEFIQSGAIGPVHEVHVITDRPKGWWPQGMTRLPSNMPAPPATLDWDLWLGPAAERPYSPDYLPFVWRGWWDFGTGALGDMGCHLMDGPFWALNLKHPTSIEAESTGATPYSPPTASMIRYQFPARDEMPPVKLTWYDGGNRPPAEVLLGQTLAPDFNGSIFVGDRGTLLVSHGSDPVLLPASRFEGFRPPAPFIPRSPGHYLEWIQACKTGGHTGSNFDYAVPLTETVLLGNVALRVGRRIEWDAVRMRVNNDPEADQYVRYQIRRGWRV